MQVIERMPATPQEINAARDLYEGDPCDIEIDDDALASRAEESGGRWVQAWVWVSDDYMSEHH